MPDDDSARAILLHGPVGSGKTTLLSAIGDLLAAQNVPHALVDLDWLAWIEPAPESTLTVSAVLTRNLAAVWPTFQDAGVQRIVMARFIENPEQLDALRDALPGIDLFVVQLSVPADALRARVHERDSGSELEEHLAFLAQPQTGIAANAEVDNAGDRAPVDVAREILGSAGWLAS